MAEMRSSSSSGVAGKKRKKSYYMKSSKRETKRQLGTGMKGVLITCSGLERMCVREAYDLLNEVADSIYGPEDLGKHSSSNEEDDDDIEKQIQKEVANLKDRKERRFNSLFSGAKNVIFIRCNDDIDPSLLVHRLLCNARDTQVQKTRFCSRVIPIVKVCSATLSEIKKHSISVLSEHFHGTDPQPREFAIRYKCRNNVVIKEKDVIDLLASVVTDDGAYDHVVNLRTPELTIFVMIIKNICCLSVLKDFVGLKQYNIQSLYTLNNNDQLKQSTEDNSPPTLPAPIDGGKNEDTTKVTSNNNDKHGSDNQVTITDTLTESSGDESAGDKPVVTTTEGVKEDKEFIKELNNLKE